MAANFNLYVGRKISIWMINYPRASLHSGNICPCFAKGSWIIHKLFPWIYYITSGTRDILISSRSEIFSKLPIYRYMFCLAHKHEIQHSCSKATWPLWIYIFFLISGFPLIHQSSVDSFFIDMLERLQIQIFIIIQV